MVATAVDWPKLWRERAEEARVHAEEMHDAFSRAMMLHIAEDYETMARRAEGWVTREERRNGPSESDPGV